MNIRFVICRMSVLVFHCPSDYKPATAEGCQLAPGWYWTNGMPQVADEVVGPFQLAGDAVAAVVELFDPDEEMDRIRQLAERLDDHGEGSTLNDSIMEICAAYRDKPKTLPSAAQRAPSRVALPGLSFGVMMMVVTAAVVIGFIAGAIAAGAAS